MKKGITGLASTSVQIVLIIILFQCLTSCESFNFDKIKPSGNLEIGVETEVANITIPSSGGTVAVVGSEIDGLEIKIKADSYASSRTFKVSTSPILNHKLGDYFNPITPLIQIDNGGGYSAEIMEITVPLQLAEGHIPLGFYYDEITGTLEGIPVKNYTENSITLLTRHFMPASDLSPSENDMKAGGIKIDASSNLVISSISESVLKMTPVISSGFKVGVDDWEFVNYGSYIATGGHCAGQNFAAMWYYYEKKLKGENNLFGNFSTTPNLWQDNGLGYRFCSVVQEDLQWDGLVKSFCRDYVDKNQELDKLKLYTIAGVILTTGEPQAIGIYRLTGGNYDDGTPKYGGHSVICTQVAVNEGKLYISDPNKPGVEQFIEFKNDKFEPYIAKLNGHAASNPYPFITFNAKSSLIEWDQIGRRYKEFADSTIGNKAPNTFPEYTIWLKGDVDQILEDGLVLDSDTLRCTVECPTAQRYWDKDGKKLLDFNLYDKDGTKISVWEGNKFSAYTILKPGLNRIGIYIYAEKSGVTYQNGSYVPLFVDFKWFNIYYSKLKIDPDPIVGEPDEEISITAMSGGSAPPNAKYIWNFGDDTKEVTVENDSIVKHKFEKEGDYDVVVSLYDNSTNQLVGIAIAEANIANGILSRLHKFQDISIDFNADMICENDINLIGSLSIDNIPAWGSTQHCPLVWSGATFSTTYDYTWETLDGENIHSTGTISGQMSANGLIIKSLTATKLSRHLNSGDVFDETITVVNVPYQADYEYDEYTPRFKVEGAKVSQHISSFNMRWDLVNSEGGHLLVISTSANYNDPNDEPYLQITFSEEK